MLYVTFDPDTGELTGLFDQDLHPSHAAHHLALQAPPAGHWTAWRMNAARTALEPAPPAAPVLTENDYMQAVQDHLDATARAHGYDHILSACSYAAAPNPFQAEGERFLAWRGEVWQYCNAVLADVQGGQRIAPTVPALLAELPALTL